MDLCQSLTYGFMATTRGGAIKIELNDALVSQLKQQILEKSTAMKELMEVALLLYLDQQKKSKSQYRFENHSFMGNGACDGVEEGSWEDSVLYKPALWTVFSLLSVYWNFS